MDNTILVALISACIPALASIITTIEISNKNNVLQDERINQLQGEIKKLTGKVEQHNNFGIQIENIKTRVEILEKKS